MKILAKDLDRGMIKLLAVTDEDIYQLHAVLAPGDMLETLTHRRVAVSENAAKNNESIRIRVKLQIRITNIDYDIGSSIIACLGTITSEHPQIKVNQMQLMSKQNFNNNNNDDDDY